MDDLRNFFTIPGWYQPLSPFTFETKFIKMRLLRWQIHTIVVLSFPWTVKCPNR